MKVEVLTHSSIRITGNYGVIYADPYNIRDEAHDAAYIFVTHDHYDHFSPEDIQKVANDNTVLIAPETMEKQVLKSTVGNLHTEYVKPGTYHAFGSLEYETVPAYNILKPFHTRGAGWVGFVLHVDGKRIYIAGDTDLTKEAKEVKCDIALIPIGGTYTMDAKKAAELVNQLRPEIAIPTHYGSVAGNEEDAYAFKKAVSGATKVEIIKQY